MLNFNNLLMKKEPTATYHKNAMQQSSNKSNFVRKRRKRKMEVQNWCPSFVIKISKNEICLLTYFSNRNLIIGCYFKQRWIHQEMVLLYWYDIIYVILYWYYIDIILKRYYLILLVTLLSSKNYLPIQRYWEKDNCNAP